MLFTSQLLFAHDLATVSQLKAENPNLQVGMVGPQVSILAQESLAAGPQLDFVARREFLMHTVTELAQSRPGARSRGSAIGPMAAFITTRTGP